MGFWGSLAKIGGVAGAPFSGGASLALTALPIAAEVGGALLKSRQASKAAKAGQRATKEAGQHRGLGYELASRALGPWASAGQGALGNLSSMVGAPSVPFPGLVGLPRPTATSLPGAPIAPAPDVLYSRAPTPDWRAQVRTAGGPGAAARAVGGGQPGRMVIVRAPTGETRQVPEAEAAHYQQRGALVIRA